MFGYYENIIKSYYSTIIRGVYSFQGKLISRENYRSDLKDIADSIKTNKGVLNVWFTDRYGKLIYHTDVEVLKDFESKRLPADYYKSINHTWKFDSGYPELNIVPIKKFLKYRISIPIYSFNHEDYDFVFGINAKRFVLIPNNIKLVIFITVGILIFSVLILFLPIFFLLKSKFETIFTQMRVLVGSVELEVSSHPSVEEKVEIKRPAKEEVVAGEGIPEEGLHEKEKEVKKPEVKRKVKEKEKPSEKNILLEFMKKKQELFKNHEIKLPTIEAKSFLFHSKNLAGNYIQYHNAESIHSYIVFDFPDIPGTSLETSIKQLQSEFDQLNHEIDNASNLKEILLNYNNNLYQNNIIRNLSILIVDKKDQSIVFTSCGKGRGIYLKNEEDRFKNIDFDIPPVGEKNEDEFLEKLYCADIRFLVDDIFIIPGFNCADTIIGGESFEGLIKRITIENRKRTVSEIGKEIQSVFEPLRRRKKDIPETGYILLKIISNRLTK